MNDAIDIPDETPVEEHAAKLDEAMARSQREEREELAADLERQHHADEQIIRALADRSDEPDAEDGTGSNA